MGSQYPDKLIVAPLSEGTTRETSEIDASNIKVDSSLYSSDESASISREDLQSDNRFNDLFLLLPPLRFGRKLSREDKLPSSRPISVDTLKCPSLIHSNGDKLIMELSDLRYVLTQLILDAVCSRSTSRKCTLILKSAPKRYGEYDGEFELDEALTRVIELLCQQILQEQYITIRVSSYHSSMRVAHERRDLEDAMRGREGEIMEELSQFLDFVNERRSQLVS